jgi:hypothetical protein
MEPKKLIAQWIVTFNEADPNALAELYADDAMNPKLLQWHFLCTRNAQTPIRSRKTLESRK